jgi:hypothetical protein
MVFNASFINISAMYIYINRESIGKGGNWLLTNQKLYFSWETSDTIIHH